MDLNQLLYHHQIALMRSQASGGDATRSAKLVDHYARRICAYRESLGLPRDRQSAATLPSRTAG